MLRDRSLLEKHEDLTLAAYGLRSRDSRGRAFPESESDYRTAFQKDRDRILHTTAFRRLEYKTQVFVNYEGDYYRTRLTHTLEVAQIGRTIARALGVNEDLVEAICLAHDLGHPPFGHSGEVVLNRLMRDQGGFDHNKQSFRILTKLERRYKDFDGLNLTWETREGIVKHETEYDISDASAFNPELRGHIEAQIANLADELAYTTHDLDDGLRSGMIRPEMLEGIKLWEVIIARTGWSRRRSLPELSRHELIRELVGLEVSDLVSQTGKRISENAIKSVDELQRLSMNVIGHSQEITERNRELKDFLFKNMYRHPRVVRMAVKAERIISDLFEAYVQEAQMLPHEVQELAQKRGLDRAVCDYLAGMTDRYAIDQHSKLFDPKTRP